MKLLVIGSGGREHALALALARSPRITEIYCAPGNAGTLALATNVAIEATDIEGLLAFASAEAIDLTIVGPEAPLVAGIVDRFHAAGLPVFGPTAAAARLEGSKAWAKGFMARHGIPTARFAIASDVDTARAYIWQLWRPEGLVIKADGLAAGKGVVVASSLDEAFAAVERMMVQRIFGAAGGTVVIEERLVGPEISVLACLDGQTWWAFPPAQDHKRLLDGDRGPNTGGMGAFSPVPQVTPEIMAQIAEQVFTPLMRGLQVEGLDYRGVVFAGLMLTADGPQVLEFNCRFGDPETQVLLPGLCSDPVELVLACLSGTLAAHRPQHDGAARLCVVATVPGYPGVTISGLAIRGIAEAEQVAGVQVFHAGTAYDADGCLVTCGGRVLNLVAEGRTLAAAAQAAYEAMPRIGFDGSQPLYRRDIGRRVMTPVGSR